MLICRNGEFNDQVNRLHGYVGKHQRSGRKRDDYQQRVQFRRVIRHSRYQHVTSDNDIALLEVTILLFVPYTLIVLLHCMQIKC